MGTLPRTDVKVSCASCTYVRLKRAVGCLTGLNLAGCSESPVNITENMGHQQSDPS